MRRSASTTDGGTGNTLEVNRRTGIDDDAGNAAGSEPPRRDASELLVRAGESVGRLDGASEVLPEGHLLLYYYVRKEAVLSSQIEGTQSSLSDLLLFESNEAPSVPLDDVVEVSSYVAALEHGLQRLTGGFPLSLRLIREMHEVLLAKGRGSNKQPGEFRTSQNWVGGSRPGNARYVPPPPDRLRSRRFRGKRCNFRYKGAFRWRLK